MGYDRSGTSDEKRKCMGYDNSNGSEIGNETYIMDQ